MAQNTVAKKNFGFINAAIETKPRPTNTFLGVNLLIQRQLFI